MYDLSKALPIPKLCDACGSNKVRFISNDLIYGTKKGAWPYIYYCSDCKALVSCHPATNKPVGKMADSHTRRLRRLAHIGFDPIWKNNYLSRSNAYKWLATKLDISIEDCHISWLNKSQLKYTIIICSEYLKTNPKQNAKPKRIKRNYRRSYTAADEN